MNLTCACSFAGMSCCLLRTAHNETKPWCTPHLVDCISRTLGSGIRGIFDGYARARDGGLPLHREMIETACSSPADLRRAEMASSRMARDFLLECVHTRRKSPGSPNPAFALVRRRPVISPPRRPPPVAVVPPPLASVTSVARSSRPCYPRLGQRGAGASPAERKTCLRPST